MENIGGRAVSRTRDELNQPELALYRIVHVNEKDEHVLARDPLEKRKAVVPTLVEHWVDIEQRLRVAVEPAPRVQVPMLDQRLAQLQVRLVEAPELEKSFAELERLGPEARPQEGQLPAPENDGKMANVVLFFEGEGLNFFFPRAG